MCTLHFVNVWTISWNDWEETSRLRINSSVATLVLKIGGASIKYVDIKPNQSNLFLNDGVHLSPSGNHEFVSTMQSALRQFIEGKSLCYPKIWSRVSLELLWLLLWMCWKMILICTCIYTLLGRYMWMLLWKL